MNFTVVANSSTSIVMTWDPPHIHQQNGIIISYSITLMSGKNTSTFTTPDEMLTLEGLRPFTSYTLDVSASTSIGPGPSTTALTVITPEDGTSDSKLPLVIHSL